MEISWDDVAERLHSLMSSIADFYSCRRSLTLLQCQRTPTFGDRRVKMRIRTPADLGALIRDHRTSLGLDQKSLAQKVGVSRQWIVDVEKGKPRAEIGLLLRTIGALGIALDAEKEDPGRPKDTTLSHAVDAHVDIDSIVAAARKKRK
jgi:HTH-type transcriptional regulator/antitoxin HipB